MADGDARGRRHALVRAYGRLRAAAPLDPSFSKPIPNLATGYEVNADATEYTFSLRKGVRWSDGEQFSADDVVFWYDAYATNTKLSPAPPDFLLTGGKVGVVKKVDDHTVRFTFPGGPNGLFPRLLATAGPAAQVTTMPRHYLQTFHERYNAGVDAQVKKAGVADWAELFAARAGMDTSNMDPDLPTLNPWRMRTELKEGGRVVFERNPYYWKTDADGNQLPYLDRVVFDVMTGVDVMLLKALGGEIDMHARGFTEDLNNKPVLARSRDKGDYRFFTMTSLGANQLLIALNLTHKSPTLRKVFQNKDFRIGLSHAINRQEIIKAVYLRQGKPYQPAPLPGSDYFNEGLAHQYTEYDPGLAKRDLDQAGFTERDRQGFRLGPDGRRITFSVDVVTEPKSWVDALNLIQGYWEEVGVRMQVNSLDRTIFTDGRQNNEHDALVWWGPPADGPSVILEPYFYFPSSGVGINSPFAKTWAWWNDGDPRGEEPPAATRRQMDLYRDLRRTADADAQAELMREILQISAEQFYVMGVAGQPLPDGY